MSTKYTNNLASNENLYTVNSQNPKQKSVAKFAQTKTRKLFDSADWVMTGQLPGPLPSYAAIRQH